MTNRNVYHILQQKISTR